MQYPHIVTQWLPIVIAIIAAYVFGGIWYGPLFGKIWAKELGLNMDQKPDPKVMRRAYFLQLVGVTLTVYVLSHSSQVWRPSVWGVGEDMNPAIHGFMCGVFTWMGFFVPQQLAKVAWEMRTWKTFFINAGHDFINLQIMAQILAHMGS